MGHESIERMIAESLEPAEPPRPGRRPLPHGNRILEQYVALCREGECGQAEPSAEVAIPVAPAAPPVPARANPVSAMIARVLARLKR